MTPMQEQYNSIKKELGDILVLFRLGDFYELFGEDAVIASKILGITLTKRGSGDNAVPMAGVPHHALPNYMPKLIEAGIKVAIADQTTEAIPGKLVERKITKIITPGTVTDENSLDDSKNNYLASVYFDSENMYYYLIYADLTTGELRAFLENNVNIFKNELKKITPSEVLILESQKNYFEIILNNKFEVIKDTNFNIENLSKYLQSKLGTKSLKGFGIENDRGILIMASVLLKYIEENSRSELKHLKSIKKYSYRDFMGLDIETIRNLELVTTTDGSYKNSLFSILNKMGTPMGKRKLRRFILNPLINKDFIADRLDSVEFFFNEPIVTAELGEIFFEISDTERIAGRIGMLSVMPRDLVALKINLKNFITIKETLEKIPNIPTRIKYLLSRIDPSSLKNIIDLIDHSILPEPAINLSEGQIINDGFNAEVDEVRSLKNNVKSILLEIQDREAKRTTIPSLKISFNKVFGYYIEITRTHLDKVPGDYIRKQTLANAERYITNELKDLEEKILNSEERLVKLERSLYFEILDKLTFFLEEILEASEAISELDVLAGFGKIATENRYVKPKLVDSNKLEIKNGRHPVVEQLIAEFTPNDVRFEETSLIHILTGPNMSGKSTFIRQTALITLMAQIGSFVPADLMEFKPVDRIFTRVGASDNLSKGESTFMVEMTETANILNNATDESLIILDEVGRGTSTYDGVAIAWSILEFIAKEKMSKTLFATHYHELTALEKSISIIKNYRVEVSEKYGEVIFLHKIIKGQADKSYGVHVAKIAGVPKEVLDRAEEILAKFETKDDKEILSKTKKEPKTPKQINPEQLGLI